jgi:hypothetical protein
MPHAPIPEGLPGIRGLFAFRPETSKPLCELAEVLLHTPRHSIDGRLRIDSQLRVVAERLELCQILHGAIAAGCCYVRGSHHQRFVG